VAIPAKVSPKAHKQPASTTVKQIRFIRVSHGGWIGSLERQSLTVDDPLSNIPTSVLPVDLPEIIGGKYRPRSVLGFGATGTVYCVEHTFTGDLLALKVLQPHLSASPDAIARFKGEARTASRLRSRHVVRIFDADVARELGGAPYLVMELLEGRNLEETAGNTAVAPELVVGWLRQAALPLEKAHEIGIVHRDLKPENIFLTVLDDGTFLVKILDFGIARIAESPGMTKSGQLFGTPLYMAPEQARGDIDKVGPPTDVFAIGLIAYRLLTGSEYRTEAGLAQMLLEILNEPLQSPSQRGHSLGEAFDRWFLRACNSDPSERFSSVRAEIEALAAAFGLPEMSSTAAVPSSGRGSAEATRASWVPSPSAGSEPPPAPVSRNAPGSLRATTIDRASAVPLKLETIPTLSGADVEDIAVQPNGWRLGFFAMCAMAAIAIGFAASRANPTSVAGAAPRVLDCPVEPVVVAPAAPAPPVALPAQTASTSTQVPPASTRMPAAPEAPKRATIAMRPVAIDRAASTVPSVPSAPSAAKPTYDDPLSDQK
jgi:eukaryotic-like serine/threonine-protein kinase